LSSSSGVLGFIRTIKRDVGAIEKMSGYSIVGKPVNNVLDIAGFLRLYMQRRCVLSLMY